MANIAAWLPAKGKAFKLGPADIPNPGPGEIVIKAKSSSTLHPGDWKLAKGIISIPLTYPAIIGNYVAGYIHSAGEGVTRFKPGDRVLSMTAVALRNDHRLNRPSKNVLKKEEKVLIWGGGSTMGWFGVQIAVQAGHQVFTTASPQNHAILKELGAVEVLDYHLPASMLSANLRYHGPYKAIFDAIGSSSQSLFGDLLAAQGGGAFITTMPINPSVILPEGVEGKFVQYADNYLKPENEEYVKWIFQTYLEEGFRDGG
ncbi:hypothetical protein BDZ45DRAFT_807605 [Acephala macrosclerotiorum]|nr:hypothetical protein BDZ45DRAFT_807605 [Acephala macrosclerotiorum]